MKKNKLLEAAAYGAPVAPGDGAADGCGDDVDEGGLKDVGAELHVDEKRVADGYSGDGACTHSRKEDAVSATGTQGCPRDTKGSATEDANIVGDDVDGDKCANNKLS